MALNSRRKRNREKDRGYWTLLGIDSVKKEGDQLIVYSNWFYSKPIERITITGFIIQ